MNKKIVITAPEAKKVPYVTTVHGNTVVDNYAWLRNWKDPEVIGYLEEENRYAEKVMAETDAQRVALFSEMKERIAEQDISPPIKIGDYWYYQKTKKARQHVIYCRRKSSMDNPEEVLLDLNKLAVGKPVFEFGELEVSPDHAKFAYSVNFDGSECYTVFVRDIGTRKLLNAPIKNTHVSLAWSNASDALFYVALDDLFRPYKVFMHKLGTSPKDDVFVYEEHDERFHVSVQKTRSQKYILICSKSDTSSEVLYIDANSKISNPKIFEHWEEGHEYHIDHCGGVFFIMTDDKGKNFRVAKTSVGKTSKEHWEEVFPHRDDVTVEHIEVFWGYLVVYERQEGCTKIRILDIKRNKHWYLDLPHESYDIVLCPNPVFRTSKLRFIYSTMITPESLFEYDMRTGEQKIVEIGETGGAYNSSSYRTRRIFATSSDGTKIPISLAYKISLKRDGTNPVFLSGYGSYGDTENPIFDATKIALMERGFVIARAHVRGGGAMGRAWHDAGKCLNKKNSFLDFIACAEYLIEQGYTQKGKIVIYGTSAGGLLIGAALNMRPDLWGAAIMSVPFLDVVNTMLDPMIPHVASDYEEWGNPAILEHYDYIRSYSPYEQIRRQSYPPILVSAGLNDSRVQYWAPAKWVAKLREMKTDNNPLVFKINMSAGHRRPSGRYNLLTQLAHECAFAIYALSEK